MRGANGLGAGFQFSGRRATLHLTKKAGVVFKNRGQIRVLRSECLLYDPERPLVERLGLGVLALSAVQLRQVVEVRRKSGVLWPQGLFVNG